MRVISRVGECQQFSNTVCFVSFTRRSVSTMPPKKSASPSRTKSPAKAPAKKGAAKAAPASSTAVSKVAAKPAAKRSASPGGKASGKTSASSPGKADEKHSSEPTAKVPEFTQDTAVVFLQSVGRGYSDRLFQGSHYYRRLRTVIEKQTEAANTKRLLLENQRRKKEREISEDVNKKKEMKAKLQEDLCVAAFDGNLAEVKKLIQQGANPLKKDGQGNYAVGEAAVNGQIEVIEYLVKQQDADPNCKGAFDRTPLWRAAYNSHAPAVKALLELGADPRVQAQAQLPSDLASGDAAQILKDWDVSKTDRIIAAESKRREEREAQVKAEAEKELKGLAETTAEAKKQYEVAQKKLVHAKQQFEQRVFEYDTAHHEGKDPSLVQIALDCVKDAEKHIAECEAERDKMMNIYLDAKAVEGEHLQTIGDLPGEEVPIRQFADIVLKDGKGSIARSGSADKPAKWPLVIDTTDKVGVFLRYRDTNYLDGCNPIQMKPEPIRKALLGSLRYGKPLVLDLKDVPLVEFMQGFFSAVIPDLWSLLLSREILKAEHYLKLVKPEDGDRFLENRFMASTVAQFVFVVVTTAFVVEEDLIQQFVPFRVVEEL